MRARFALFGRLAVEVLNQRRTMMLFDKVDDRFRKMVLASQVGTIFHVGDDDQRAHGRLEGFVAIGSLALIFNEVIRLEHLADVVKVSPRGLASHGLQCYRPLPQR